jgi:prophage DNA circulation protein
MAMLGVLALLAGCTATPPPSVAGESATTNTATVAASGTPVTRTTGPVQVAQAAKLMVDASSRYRELLRSLTVLFGAAFVLRYIVFESLYAPTGGTLARLQAYTPAITEPAVVIAQRLYGSAGLDSRADELIARNRVKHPGFVPGSVTIQVVTPSGGNSDG